MERTQYDWQHDYRATPLEYPIADNRRPATYDQFITLRDTLIFSDKYYTGKGWLKLVVWDSEETVEVLERQIFRQSIQPDSLFILSDTITSPTGELAPLFWTYKCIINKDGRYRIIHKEEIRLSSSTDKVYCYVDLYRKDSQWQYVIAIKWGICVFDWEWAGWDYTLGQLFKKMTAYGYLETDLKKDDILVLRMKDATYNSSTWEPQGNDLTLQNDSNYFSVEYIDLPYNK